MAIKSFMILGALVFFLLQVAKPKQETKLIVLIAVDGLRGDLLNKYKPALKHGLRRMFDEGYEFKNAWVDHGITVSHAGHVTIATGNYPRNHGIVDAAFYEKQGDSFAFTEGFADSTYALIGVPDSKSISLKKVLTPGLAEWIKGNKTPGKILSVGTGNISSSLYCFHRNEHVFWYSADHGKYVTSTYFLDKEPEWVTAFNKEKLPDFFKKSKTWSNIVPDNFLSLSNKDDEPSENYGQRHTFPYVASARVEKENLYNLWIANTPEIDNATLAIAKQGIESLSIGKGSGVDFVSIVLSQVDNSSHNDGPSSLETFNVILQIDIALGDFFNFLDEHVGKGKYVVGLTSDHGFPEIPEQTMGKQQEAKRLTENVIENTLDTATFIQSRYKNKSERIAAVKDYLLSQEFIADVYTPYQLNDQRVSKDAYLELYKKSHREDRVPRLPFFSLKSFQSQIGKDGMMVRLKKNMMIDLDCVIHGSPYEYDRFVPLLFMGQGVKHGSSNRKVRTIDIAPTLARLANIEIKNKTDGEPLF